MARLCPITRLPCTHCCDDAKPCKTQEHIADFLRSCGSIFEPEAIASFTLFYRFCKKNNLSFSDLGNRFEDMKYNEADADRIHAHGVAQGQEEQARLQVPSNSRTLSADYFDDNGTPRWDKIIKLGEDNLFGLTQKQQDVIIEIQNKLRHWGRPNPWQEGFLISTLWTIRRSLR